MNKLLLAFCCVAAASMATAQNKLDFNARQAMEAYEARVQAAGSSDHVAAVRSSVNDESRLILVALKSAANAADIESLGYEIEDQFGDIVMIQVPLKEVNLLAEKDYVVQISFGGEARPLLDKAREASKVNPIHDGSGEGLNATAYTGQGVVVGVYDTGLDPNHINFRDRVKGVYQVKGQSASMSAALTANQIKRFTTDNTGETHGTHVLGIAAGGYKGTLDYAGTVAATTGNSPYYGVATGSDLIIGCGDLYNECILKGVRNIIEHANDLGKPAVINLSLGTNSGAHDGKDNFGRSLDELGKQAIIVVAAGNEGDLPMGLTKRLTAEDNVVRTFPVPITSTGSNSASDFNGTIEIYANDSEPFTCRIVTVKNSGLSGYEILGEYVVDSSTSGRTTTVGGSSSSATVKLTGFDQATSATSSLKISSNVDTYSKRYGVTITHTLDMSKSTSPYLGIIIEGKAGQLINFYGNTNQAQKNKGTYTTFVSHFYNGWEDGSCNGSINSMACGDNVLVVGSWNTRNSWYRLGGGRGGYGSSADYAVGNVSGFSSYGTIYNGTDLPHVLAPGCGIISSVSNYFSGLPARAQLLATLEESDRQNPYDYMQGTSMATPFVTGTVALWLEADPTLTVADVKDIAMKTAVMDSYLEKADPVKVGAGKLDALAGLREVLRRANTGVEAIVDDATSNLIVEAKGENIYSVFFAGATDLTATVYAINGQEVAVVSERGDELTLDLSKLAKGLYVADVAAGNSGHETVKLLVK
ncbi:MAG: S8 family serine peptidase [Muribaculaceae bacterium]|nr:S8 family serine peptidase [Muribaculaceae bacterium]